MKPLECTHCRAKFGTYEAADAHIHLYLTTETPHYSYRDMS
jgi:hypothetical protein